MRTQNYTIDKYRSNILTATTNIPILPISSAVVAGLIFPFSPTIAPTITSINAARKRAIICGHIIKVVNPRAAPAKKALMLIRKAKLKCSLSSSLAIVLMTGFCFRYSPNIFNPINVKVKIATKFPYSARYPENAFPVIQPRYSINTWRNDIIEAITRFSFQLRHL